MHVCQFHDANPGFQVGFGDFCRLVRNDKVTHITHVCLECGISCPIPKKRNLVQNASLNYPQVTRKIDQNKYMDNLRRPIN